LADITGLADAGLSEDAIFEVTVAAAVGAGAAARIPWHLIAEQDASTVILRLLCMDETHYVEQAVAKTGETLPLPAPFTGEIDTSTWLGR
jgi:hypothetical protein